jgi:hypothetical protein
MALKDKRFRIDVNHGPAPYAGDRWSEISRSDTRNGAQRFVATWKRNQPGWRFSIVDTGPLCSHCRQAVSEINEYDRCRDCS